jgi:photosystem II stability/assembly factor-like uncharacterized protein
MAISFRQLARRRNITLEQVELLYRLRGLNREGIELLPDPSLRRSVRRLDVPDAPRERLASRADQYRDDQGQIPPLPLVHALRQLDSFRIRSRSGDVAGIPTGGPVQPGHLGVLPTAGLAPRKWRALGPGNIGGRTRSILVHRINHDTMWVASASGGIWRSDNGGQNWTPVDDLMANLAVTSLADNPTDPNVIYAGTGEGFGNVDATRGGGIYRTTDGTRWMQLPSTSGSDWNWVNRVAVNADGAVLLAATNKGLRRSADPARMSWQTVLPKLPVADVAFHPTDPRRAVAGSLSTGAAWYSTDGGASWKQASHAEAWGRRVELCYAKARPDIVYASVDAQHGEIWRSVNGGRSFTRRRSRSQNQAANYLGDQGWYGNSIWAGDPTNPDLIIVGGVDLWRSTDGGDTLQDISTWSDSRSAHADHHAIVSHPDYDGHNNRTVFFGNDGGIYRANDVTTVGNDAQPPRISGWINLNNSYGVTQFYSAAGNRNSGVIIGGAQDNGTLAYDPAAGPDHWRTIFGGDGGFCAADPTDPSIFYGEYVYLNIHRNTDGATSDDTGGDRYISGQFWNAALNQWDWKPVPFQIPDAFNQRALFIAPFVLDPNEPNRILAGGESLWRTNDARAPNTPTSGPHWTRIKPPSNGLISAIAVTTGNSDRVWIGYDDGEVWSSVNATAATPIWTEISGQGPMPLAANRPCNRILISPHDANTILVAFGGFASGNIWRTDDGGASWTDLSGALPEAPVRGLAIHPAHPEWFYCGTEVGVFASEDRGATWSPTNEGPANVSVDDFFWMDQRLICVTHGRGLFEIDL